MAHSDTLSRTGMTFNIMWPGSDLSGGLEISYCVTHLDDNDPFEDLSSSPHILNNSKWSYLIDFTW